MSEAKKVKILTAARLVFLRHGYRRVSMNDIADEASMSRAALYLAFKNKEEIFIGTFMQWVDETIAEIRRGIENLETAEEQIQHAFELWSVRPFEMMMRSPEARELVECSLEFAQDSLRQGHAKFEATLVPVLVGLAQRQPTKAHMEPEKIARVLASAARGFKQTAATPDELRQLIKDLLILSFRLDDDSYHYVGGHGDESERGALGKGTPQGSAGLPKR